MNTVLLEESMDGFWSRVVSNFYIVGGVVVLLLVVYAVIYRVVEKVRENPRAYVLTGIAVTALLGVAIVLAFLQGGR